MSAGESQYASETTETDPDEKLQPQTVEDKTSKTRAETAKEYLGYSTTKAVLAVLLTIIFILFLRQYFPRIYYNQILRVVVAAGTYTAVLGTVVYRSATKKVLSYDELTLHLPNGAKRYYGEFSEDSDGNKTFLPYKGFNFFYSPIPLEWGDLNVEAVNTFAKRTKSDDEEAVIGLNDAITNVTYTDTGVVVTAHSAGLEADPKGRDRDLRLSMPETLDKSELGSVKNLLEKYETEIVPELESKIQTKQRQLDDARSKLRDREEDAFDRAVDKVRSTSEAMKAGEPETIIQERRRGGDDR